MTRKKKADAREHRQHEIPEGFEERSADILGFFIAGDEPIQFRPLTAKIIDNSADGTKHSVLIVCSYIAGPAVDGGGEPIELSRGDLCGLWYSPGMKSLQSLAGVEVYMVMSGVMDTGKPNPMKTYTIAARRGAKGGAITISEDHRKTSKGTVPPFPIHAG